MIYIESALGNVIAVDGKTGVDQVEVHDAARHGTRRGVAVAKDLGIVYTLGRGNSLVALRHRHRRRDAGARAYDRAASATSRRSALVYHDKRLYIGTNDGNRGAALTVDATNGTC